MHTQTSVRRLRCRTKILKYAVPSLENARRSIVHVILIVPEPKNGAMNKNTKKNYSSSADNIKRNIEKLSPVLMLHGPKPTRIKHMRAPYADVHGYSMHELMISQPLNGR